MNSSRAGRACHAHRRVFKDEDPSGGNLTARSSSASSADPPSEIGGIVVATLDRFSRDTGDFLMTLREIEQLGGRLLCGDGEVSLQNGTDTFIATVRVAAERWSGPAEGGPEGLGPVAIERGHHLSAPFGTARRTARAAAGASRRGARGRARVRGPRGRRHLGEGRRAMNDTGVMPRPFTRAHDRAAGPLADQDRPADRPQRGVPRDRVHGSTARPGRTSDRRPRPVGARSQGAWGQVQRGDDGHC